ncbi:MAG TPA: OmpH family outer membrane protein [Terriglobia bacterium]|nr:OmpH family outer membrane protein [Terriglobia bacterium]
MIRLKLPILLVSALLVPSYLFSQAKVAVVDFERAIVESVEGKKASAKFNGRVEAVQKDLEKRQKELEDLSNRLRTQDRVLSDVAKADLQKDIERRQTELTRLNEDAQKELNGLRDELLRPIAEIASRIMQVMAAERGFTLVVDVSNPQSSVIYVNPAAEITADLTKRIDTELAKQPPPSATPPAAATPRPPATPPAGAAPRPPAGPAPRPPATTPGPPGPKNP